MERHPGNQKPPNREEQERERLSRLKKQEAYDVRMIRALATVGIVCHDHLRGTWKAEDYFVSSRQSWITKAEAGKRWADCQTGLVFDGWLGVGRPLTDQEKAVHLLDGNVCLDLPEDYIQPMPFGGSQSTEVV